MKTFTETYMELGKDIMDNGHIKIDHKGKTRMLPATTFVVEELEHGLFPMLTTKFTPVGAAIREYEAFTKDIKDKDALINKYKLDNIWGPWFKDNDRKEVKLDYFKNWKQSTDYIVNKFNKDNHSRKLYHNQFTFDSGSDLSCCWDSFQLLKINGKLNLIFKMISTDFFKGLPADVATAAVILMNFCSVLDQEPGKIYVQSGDLHIYKTHFRNMDKLLRQEIKYTSPVYALYKQLDMSSFISKELIIDGYKYNEGEYDNVLVHSIKDNR